jgi:hypothetical protein
MPLSMRFAGRGRNVGALVRPPNRPRSLCSCRFRRGATISFWAHRDDVLASHLLTDPPGGPTGGRLRTGRPGGLGDGQGAGRRGWLAFACPPKRSPVRLTRSLFAPPCPREPCVQAVLGLGGAVVAPLPHPLSGRDPCVQARFPLAQSIPFLGAGKTRAAFSHTANHPLGGLTGPAVCALAGSSRWRVERCSGGTARLRLTFAPCSRALCRARPVFMRFRGQGRNACALVRPLHGPQSLCSCRFRWGARLLFLAHRDDVLARTEHQPRFTTGGGRTNDVLPPMRSNGGGCCYPVALSPGHSGDQSELPPPGPGESPGLSVLRGGLSLGTWSPAWLFPGAKLNLPGSPGNSPQPWPLAAAAVALPAAGHKNTPSSAVTANADACVAMNTPTTIPSATKRRRFVELIPPLPFRSGTSRAHSVNVMSRSEQRPNLALRTN